MVIARDQSKDTADAAVPEPASRADSGTDSEGIHSDGAPPADHAKMPVANLAGSAVYPMPARPDFTFREYMIRSYARWIGGEDKVIVDGLRWYAAGKRPVMGLRWGIGVFAAERASSPRRHSRLSREPGTGSTESDLATGLDNRVAGGRFGRWPPPIGSFVSNVPVCSVNNPDEFIREASRQCLDGLAAVVMTSETVGLNRQLRVNLEVRLIDVVGGKTLWTSPRLNSQMADATRGMADDATTELVGKALSRLDVIGELQPMPALSESVVKARIRKLEQMDHSLAGRLRALVEVRYYAAKQLATAADVRAAYEALLGIELAAKMESAGVEAQDSGRRRVGCSAARMTQGDERVRTRQPPQSGYTSTFRQPSACFAGVCNHGKARLQFFTRPGRFAPACPGRGPARPAGPARHRHLDPGDQPPLEEIRADLDPGRIQSPHAAWAFPTTTASSSCKAGPCSNSA